MPDSLIGPKAFSAMKPSLAGACVPRSWKRIAFWVGIILPLYVLSTGPVAWATNDADHPAYLPDGIWVIYLPLAPLGMIPGVSDLFELYTVTLWQGFPSGYTTP